MEDTPQTEVPVKEQHDCPYPLAWGQHSAWHSDGAGGSVADYLEQTTGLTSVDTALLWPQCLRTRGGHMKGKGYACVPGFSIFHGGC